jgi:Calcineurin-like phosphoesterase
MLLGMPVTFIGDVHGWSLRLDRILDQVTGDLVFMGDLLDRGPDAPGVLRRVKKLCDDGRARCLMGNHEYTLLRSLGFPGSGFAPDPRLFDAWSHGFGGHAVMKAYGVKTADALGVAMRESLAWLVKLPWVLEGDENDRHWVAVHAGLSEYPLAPQLSALHAGWDGDDGAAMPLFNKTWAHCIPNDLPMNWCIVSGHTPVRKPLITPQRILCDTSGGLADRQLSAVEWPSGRIIQS